MATSTSGSSMQQSTRSVQESGTSNQQASQQQPERAAYLISGSTMRLQEHQLMIQVENPIDFMSLMFHGCDIKDFYATQGWLQYFKMLNGPTYKALVRHFWVRASIYDKKAAVEEERNLVLLYPELAGKSRKEMLLEPFTGTEIRSSVMGVPVKINEKIIAFFLGIKAEGIYCGIEIPNPQTST